MSETNEKLITPAESPVSGYVRPNRAQGGNCPEGEASAIHHDSGRCEWAKGRGESVFPNGEVSKKASSAHDAKMGRDFDCGGNYAPCQPEKHDSKMVGAALANAAGMGSERPSESGNDPSSVKLRVPLFRKK